MKFSVISVHPNLIKSFSKEALMKRAIQDGLIQLKSISLRDFASPPHYRVDDRPYGGGAGMVFKCEPVVRSLEKIDTPKLKTRKILLSAKGRRFTQASARRLSRYEHLIFICGRYEGVDERIAEHYVDEELRIGNYVLMGGELAACVMIEAISRLVPGVLGNQASLEEESFSLKNEKEYKQYTRPRVFEGHVVPEVLVSGHHSKIKEWRKA